MAAAPAETIPPWERPEVLRMRDITKSFPGVKALSGVSLTVHEGETLALLGENGAGKSTLMNILAGVFPDYGGQIEVSGTPVHLHSPKASQQLGIAMIHQELNLVPEMSISDNIFLGREPKTRTGAVNQKLMRSLARELLRSVGLTLDPRRLVRNCRVAEQQLIEVAKALSLDVKVLVMDEPTSALADAEVQQLFTAVRSLARNGVAIIYISHRFEEIEEIADRVTVIRDGAFIGERTVAEATRSELISMMVGRELGALEPRTQTPETGAVQLEVRSLSLAGDKLTTRQGLHDVSFTVRAGEIVGLAGLMGAGRSETLEAIFGVFPRRECRADISIQGRRYRPRTPKHAIKAGIAFVAEDRKAQSLILGNTIRFNASLAALGRLTRWLVVSKKKERQRVGALFTSLRVKAPSMESLVGNLSGGNQQKVVLAKCLMTDPGILLLDEPTRGIDVGAKAEIYTLMNQLAERGNALVMVSSELPELLANCDRIVVLCEGRVTRELDRNEATQEAILEAAMARRTVTASGANLEEQE